MLQKVPLTYGLVIVNILFLYIKNDLKINHVSQESGKRKKKNYFSMLKVVSEEINLESRIGKLYM